jgi:MFS family permease
MPLLALAGSLTVTVVVLAAFAIAFTFVMVPVLPELAALSQRLSAGYGGAFALFNGAYAVGTLVGPVAGGVGLAVTSTRVVYAVAGAVVAVGGLLFLAVEAAARSPLRPALLPGESMKE